MKRVDVTKFLDNHKIGSRLLFAGNLLKQLIKQYPTLKELNSIAIAVNGNYSNTDTIVSSGDEIALIPPVSGG